VLAARLVTAVVLIAGLLAALFLLPPTSLAAVIGILVALAAFEWARLCRLAGGVAWIYAAAVFLGSLALWSTELRQPLFMIAAAFWVVVAPIWLWRGVVPGHTRLLSAIGFVVLLPAALAMATLRPTEVVMVLGLVCIADTAAYFAGRALGRHKLAPSISPGKTWEGAAGGLVGVLAYAIFLGTHLERVSWMPYLAAALLLGVLSIVGDLFESALKRQAGAKDSGSLLPGHGGVLDRIDSATATLPVAALLWPMLAST
jgi:phosphatidate cytidylyltransferase